MVRTLYRTSVNKIFTSQSTYYAVPNVIGFPRYNMICSGENVILRGIFHIVTCFPLHFMLYRGNFDCFSNSVGWKGNTYKSYYLRFIFNCYI